MQKVDSCRCVTHSRYVSEHIYTGPNQWQIKGASDTAYFLTKLRPKEPEKFFWETGPPSYLRVWMTAPAPPLILSSGSSTATGSPKYSMTHRNIQRYCTLNCPIRYIYILTVHSAKQKGISNITGEFIMSARLALWPELNLLGLSQPQGVH